MISCIGCDGRFLEQTVPCPFFVDGAPEAVMVNPMDGEPSCGERCRPLVLTSWLDHFLYTPSVYSLLRNSPFLHVAVNFLAIEIVEVAA